MSKREVIAHQLEQVREEDLDKLLAFLQSLKGAHADIGVSTFAAESALAKDWLTPEEDEAWAGL